MLLDYCYPFGLSLWPSGLKKFFEEGDPMTYFDPPWIRPLADLAENNNTCWGPLVLHLYQFSSKSIKCF